MIETPDQGGGDPAPEPTDGLDISESAEEHPAKVNVTYKTGVSAG